MFASFPFGPGQLSLLAALLAALLRNNCTVHTAITSVPKNFRPYFHRDCRGPFLMYLNLTSAGCCMSERLAALKYYIAGWQSKTVE